MESAVTINAEKCCHLHIIEKHLKKKLFSLYICQIFIYNYIHYRSLSGRDRNLRYKIIKTLDIHLLEPYKIHNESNYKSWASFP